jgi:hypothetical protein
VEWIAQVEKCGFTCSQLYYGQKMVINASGEKDQVGEIPTAFIEPGMACRKTALSH